MPDTSGTHVIHTATKYILKQIGHVCMFSLTKSGRCFHQSAMTACLVALCVCVLSYSWQHIETFTLFAAIRDLSVFYNIVVTVIVSQSGILIRKMNNL